MHDTGPPTPPPGPSRYAGWAIALFVIGGLIATVSGLCTGAIVIVTATDRTGNAYDTGILGFAMIVGGIPFLVGVAMIVAARNWGRRKPPSDNLDWRAPKP